MSTSVKFTKHARKRYRKRRGGDPKAARAEALEALAFGINAADARAELRDYLLSKVEDNLYAVAFKGLCWVFATVGDDEVVVTVFNLPAHAMNSYLKQAKGVPL